MADTKTRAERLAEAQKLLTRAMLPTCRTDHEAENAHRQYMKLVVAYGFTLDELRPPAGASAAWTIDDFMRAAERGKEVIASARAVLADPDVQKTVGALRDLGAAGVKAWKAIKGRRAGT